MKSTPPTSTPKRFRKIANCIGCHCSDTQACPGGCHWVRLDRALGTGVCSRCGYLTDEWDNGRRL